MRAIFDRASSVQKLLIGCSSRGMTMMSLVRLLGFTTLACGCVTGRYREVATHREIVYVEEKGHTCTLVAHRQNHTLTVRALRAERAAADHQGELDSR